MIPKDLFAKIRRIEITTSRLVTDVFAGQYHSVFKGQGIEFDEVREYQMGDDIRAIDWNVTARTGQPHVKKYVEERELTVMIVVDVSCSQRFGTVNNLKSQLAAEISALLALSAIRNNDKVGLIVFTDRIEKFIPPRKGLQHVLRIIREVLYFEPQGRSTDIVAAMEYLVQVVRRKSIVFLLSDFLGNDSVTISKHKLSLQKMLSMTNKRHDLIAITINDPKEYSLPESGMFVLEDAETGKLIYVDTANPEVRRRYQESNLKRMEGREKLFRSVGMDYMNISTGSSYVEEVVKFFLKRRRRVR